jgi:DNA-binding transcriptional ArsR family regulator
MPSNDAPPQHGAHDEPVERRADEPAIRAAGNTTYSDAHDAHDSVVYHSVAGDPVARDPVAADRDSDDDVTAAALGRAAPRRPATEAEARALASAIRLRIMRLCLDLPLTNKEIAERLGANPATTLHHVRRLVATGFLAPQKERRGTRGAREVPYLATGKSWTLSVHEHAEGSGRAMVDAFLEEIAYVDIDAAQEADDPDDPSGFSRLGLRLPAKDLVELGDRMSTLLNEYALKPADMTDGIPYSIFLAFYRDVTRP